MFILVSNMNTADTWLESKERAESLRRYRWYLPPHLAAELAELERIGY